MTSTTSPKGKTTVELPDLLSNWPFPRSINPHFHTVAGLSADWIDTFNAFDDAGKKVFRKANFGLIASLAYHRADAVRLRTGCDLMNAFFVFDDISDKQPSLEVRKLADVIMNAMRNPQKPRPLGETVLGVIHQSFWSLALETASETSRSRFVRHYQEYVNAVCLQAEDRDQGHVRSIDEYMRIRRCTIGAQPSFDLLLLHVEIPADVLEHPIVLRLERLAIDMIILANDVYSYNVEQSRGDDGHNMVTVTMKEHHLDVQGAMNFIGRANAALASEFLQLTTRLPYIEDHGTAASLREYVMGLGNWVTANIHWSFESERYFGTRGVEIKVHRKIELLPRATVKSHDHVTPPSLHVRTIWSAALASTACIVYCYRGWLPSLPHSLVTFLSDLS